MPKDCGGESWLKRAQRLRQPLGLPDLDGGAYLLEAMFRIGPVRETGLSATAPDWSEIDAFARQTGRISEPWEAEVLFDMCRGYLDELRAGENPLAIPPVERKAQ
ncbi:MAG: hypothetical protein COB97_09210 [Paracoccus sp.]|nr:MAG: hypothetical protein COB97_09210 [Paracoccus sp. (in: a-proteobacteria)]